MGTTLSALILHQSGAFIAHVGDSRIYRLRDGLLMQLTIDHTYVEEQVRGGTMTREQAESSPYAHVLMRGVGVDGDAEPDIERFDVAAGDTYLLCSDGLSNHAGDAVIADLLALPPGDGAWKLVSYALADGGSDNCTAIVVRVDSVDPI
jgi:serine/threonine protein phosphatase PrpC